MLVESQLYIRHAVLYLLYHLSIERAQGRSDVIHILIHYLYQHWC